MTKASLGQLVYDLIFTDLTPAYVARKHRMPVADVRWVRAAAKETARKRKRKRAQAAGEGHD